MNRSAGTQNAAAASSGPAQCDRGVSRHSLHAAALRERAYPSLRRSPEFAGCPGGHGMDSRRPLLDGNRSHGGRAAGPRSRSQRLLDGSHRRDERRVRAVRQGNGLRDDRRTPAQSEGISQSRSRRVGCRFGCVHAARRIRFRWTILSHGGALCAARTGGIPKARTAICEEKKSIP